MIRAFTTAMRTLTAVPVPGQDAKNFASSLYFFPVVGLLVGWAVGGAVYLVDSYSGWKELAAIVGVLVSVRATGCLHVDGLADVCDSFGSRSREKRLAIMKDSSSGVYGVVGIVFSLLLKYLCVMRLDGRELLVALPVVFVVSRAAQVVVMSGMPYARPEGTARAFVNGAASRHGVVAILIAGVYAFCMTWFMGLAIVGLAMVIAALVRVWARRAFGGVTGDVIGFTNELVEIALLVLIGVILG